MSRDEETINAKSVTRENYEMLIELIDETLLNLHRDKNRLVPETCEGLFLRFSELLKEDEIKKSVSNNNWVLQQISERNCERHKRLVELLTRRFELRQSMISNPRGASAIFKNEEILHQIDDLNKQIDEIIQQAEREIDGG